MTVLVTGASGFLGGRLVEHLVQSGVRDVVVGTRSPSRVAERHRGLRIARMDWDSPASLNTACKGIREIFHLAALGAGASAAEPTAAFQVNGVYTARLIEAAVRQGVRRVVYLSTAHVYGEPLVGRIDESHATEATHPYATSHLAGEGAVLAAHDQGVIEGVVIRLSNAFGPPVNADVDCWSLLVNDLCRQAATTGRLVLRSSGLQQRDFIPLTTACAAIDHLSRVPAAELAGGVFNVGGRWSRTAFEMAELVRERGGAVLGADLPLARPAAESAEAGAPLDFRIDALLATGFRLFADPVNEIDRLLVFCRESFPSRWPCDPS